LIEFPLPTIQFFWFRLPVAWGGYFRLYPYAFTRAALERINRKQRQPFVFYLHPWELDPDQPRIDGTAFAKFRHYNNLHKCEERLRHLLNDFELAAIRDVLTELKF
jgi:hypothetical protein